MTDLRITTREISKDGARLFHSLRWSYGVVICPYCGSLRIVEKGDYKYRCSDCGSRFSDKTKTLLHGSKLSVEVWMLGIYEILHNNFISSISLGKKLEINQKSAWLMMSKIRYVLDMEGYKLSGIIAQDEMYVGGCLSNYHYGRKLELLRRSGYLEEDNRKYTKSAIYALNSDIKQPVFGMNDGNKVVLYATPNPIKKEYIQEIYRKHVVGDSIVVSDESKLYNDWETKIGEIHTNNHKNNQYKTSEGYTSNKIENTFSWYKRGFNSRITHCKYHQLYLNEWCFRYNTRYNTDNERFRMVIGCNKEVTYEDIKRYNSLSAFSIKHQKKRHIYTLTEIKGMFNELVREIRLGSTIYRKEDFE